MCSSDLPLAPKETSAEAAAAPWLRGRRARPQPATAPLAPKETGAAPIRCRATGSKGNGRGANPLAPSRRWRRTLDQLRWAGSVELPSTAGGARSTSYDGLGASSCRRSAAAPLAPKETSAEAAAAPWLRGRRARPQSVATPLAPMETWCCVSQLATPAAEPPAHLLYVPPTTPLAPTETGVAHRNARLRAARPRAARHAAGSNGDAAWRIAACDTSCRAASTRLARAGCRVDCAPPATPLAPMETRRGASPLATPAPSRLRVLTRQPPSQLRAARHAAGSDGDAAPARRHPRRQPPSRLRVLTRQLPSRLRAARHAASSDGDAARRVATRGEAQPVWQPQAAVDPPWRRSSARSGSLKPPSTPPGGEAQPV